MQPSAPIQHEEFESQPSTSGRLVQHVYVEEGGKLSDVVAKATGLSPDAVTELLRFGAIWYAPVPPLPHPKAMPFVKPEHLEQITNARRRAKEAGQPK
eukprot:2569222-Pyramimonas_sp.AAC.1